MVNLTCGRNPWKRASYEDSTFRAFMKDPKFLRSILPVSMELDAIMKRIFEYNPAKRITIPELRELIVRCPNFTASKSAAPTPLPSPPFSPVEYASDAGFYQIPAAPLPSPVYPPPTFELPFPRYSTSLESSQADNESVFSSCSSVSSTSSSESFGYVAPISKPASRPTTYVSPPPTTNAWYHPFIQAANLVKHVSFQPPVMASPLHVY